MDLTTYYNVYLSQKLNSPDPLGFIFKQNKKNSEWLLDMIESDSMKFIFTYCMGYSSQEVQNHIGRNVRNYLLSSSKIKMTSEDICSGNSNDQENCCGNKQNHPCLCTMVTDKFSSESHFEKFRSNKKMCECALEFYARFLYLLGIVIEDPVTGSLQRIRENCYTFEDGIKLLKTQPRVFACVLDTILLTLLKLGFGNYVFELFSFFSNESHQLPDEFVSHWLEKQTVHIMAILLRLNPHTLHEAFKKWDNISPHKSQDICFEQGLLNCMFGRDSDTQKLCIDFDTEIVTSIIPLNSRKSSRFARTASAACCCKLPAVFITPKTIPTSLPINYKVQSSAKQQYRSSMVKNQNLTNPGQKRKLALPPSNTFRRPLTGSNENGPCTNSELLNKIRMLNTLSINVCPFWKDGLLNCKQFSMQKYNKRNK